MKKGGKAKHTKRNIALLALLAVLCICATELIFCRWFEPELYERIVSPVRYAVSVAADAGRAGVRAVGGFFQSVGRGIAGFAAWTGEQASAFWEELTAPKAALGPSALPGPPGSSELTKPSTDEPVFSAALPTPVPVTELLEVNGKQILTGGNVDVTYFCQKDDQWADQPFGTDNIGIYGCGPTVMAIAVATLTDTDTDPAVMAAWAAEHGYWARKAGSYISIVQGTAKSFGIKTESFTSREADDLLDALSQGKMLIALMGPGQFTTVGHFILLRGVTMSGQVLIADPNSPENSLTAWDAQVILDELSSARSSGAPLWALWTSD